MNYLLCLPWMIFAHVIDDYGLQGILASLKQKETWEKMDGYKDFYKYDYIAALIFHSFSWSFATLIPIFVFRFDSLPIVPYFIMLIVQTAIHAFVDDLKANKKSINLVQDQAIHMIQILFSWVIFIVF